MFELAQEPVINLLTPAEDSAGYAFNYLTLVLSLLTALAFSMFLIPVMVRLAPRLGMIDLPDSRKVHDLPVPRVGGIGIVIGTLVPVALIAPLDQQMLAFISGALVLFCFGVLDDCKELGHFVKFIGQFIAVIIVVFYGDVYVTLLPFMGGEPVPDPVGRLFTVFAMVGMINAINHSDGLDGLAGGESLLSLMCISWLAWLADGEVVLIIALATIGGLFGFMRFNTHPAKIFMGDGGSQFLGYTLGYLAVLLTQDVNPVLSPALPALILGLPIADIIVVFIQRIYRKMNWFRASRNHIHHRLLDLRFYHHESVVLVYSVQALLVTCAVLMPYEADLLIVGVYLGVVSAVFVLLYLAERSGWTVRRETDVENVEKATGTFRYSALLESVPFTIVYYGVALFLVAGAVLATDVPVDFTVAAVVLTLLLLVRLSTGYRFVILSLRLLVYVTILFVAYLLNMYQPHFLAGIDSITYVFFGLVMAGIALTIRFSNKQEFDVTPMDYLIVLAMIMLGFLTRNEIVNTRVMAIALKTVILFYGAEVILNRMSNRLNLFTLAILVSLLVVVGRGLLLHVL